MTKKLFTTILIIHSIVFTNAQNKVVEIDSLIKGYISINKFNGVALIIQDGKTMYSKGYGYQNALNQQPNTSKSIFPIGSLTKPFTALVVLKLVEEHKLTVEDPLSRYIPDYPNGDQIKIKHLLSNSGGIYEKFRNPAFVAHLTSARNFNNDEKLGYFKNQPLDFEPGTKFSYSNSGFDLLGMIIEKVTGSSYAEAVHKYILKPLKMRSSGFDFPNLRNKKKVIAYSFISSTKQVETQTWNASLTFSSGGLYSTVEDLHKFYDGLVNFKIVNKETFELATKPYLDGYGYGWFIDQIQGETVINHGGNVEGATSYFIMNPALRICIILLNNITSTSLENLGNNMYSALRGRPYRVPQPRQEIQLDERTLQQYVGIFKVSENYKVAVSNESGRLFIKINEENKFPMLAEKDNVFYTNDSDIALEFLKNEGKIMQLKLRQGLSTKVADRM